MDVKKIRLTEDELDRCMEFSNRSAPNQQDIEFGQRSTKARSTREIARDNLIGKIAEVAFSKMMKENYGIDVPLDFNYYPRGQWDSQDAVINGWRIDVKGTRKGGHWMLIEWNKLNFRQRDNNLSHLYAMFSVDGTDPRTARQGLPVMRGQYLCKSFEEAARPLGRFGKEKCFLAPTLCSRRTTMAYNFVICTNI